MASCQGRGEKKNHNKTISQQHTHMNKGVTCSSMLFIAYASNPFQVEMYKNYPKLQASKTNQHFYILES